MKLAPKSLMLSYIHGGQVWEAFMRSMIDFKDYDREHDNLLWHIAAASGLYLHCNRNTIARQFLNSPCEVLVSLDTDIVFPAKHVYGLVDALDPVSAPIVSGIYFGYVGTARNLMPIWFLKERDGEFQTVGQIAVGRQELAAIGMGFCAIHRSALEKIGEIEPEGWFDHIVVRGTDEVSRKRKLNYGEDMAFCVRAAQAGCRIVGDASLIVEHIKSRPENYETFMRHWGIPKPPETNGLIHAEG